MATDYGIQDDGSFRRKHVDEVEEDTVRELKNRLGEDVELRQRSELKQIVDTMAIEFALQWQALEDVYFDTFFEDASGEALDKQLALAGFTRLPQRSATGEVKFTTDSAASDDVQITAGTVVTTEETETTPAIPFETTEPVTLAAGTTSVTAPIEALKPWQTDLDEEWLGEETNVAANTITQFDSPVAGVDAVTNPLPAGDPDEGFQVGRDRETDPEFKLRYQNSISGSGAATLRAIESAVFAADQRIQSVDVEEVRDSANDDYGVRITVLAPGVPDDVIAQAIFESRAAGLESFGAESGQAEDDGLTSTENFDRAVEKSITVDVSVTTSDTYPADGNESIQDRIIRYIGGEDSSGVSFPGLGVDEDVIFDQVKRRALEERGVIEATVEIAESGNALGSANITVPDGEAATTSTTEVTVSVA